MSNGDKLREGMDALADVVGRLGAVVAEQGNQLKAARAVADARRSAGATTAVGERKGHTQRSNTR